MKVQKSISPSKITVGKNFKRFWYCIYEVFQKKLKTIFIFKNFRKKIQKIFFCKKLFFIFLKKNSSNFDHRTFFIFSLQQNLTEIWIFELLRIIQGGAKKCALFTKLWKLLSLSNIIVGRNHTNSKITSKTYIFALLCFSQLQILSSRFQQCKKKNYAKSSRHFRNIFF